MSTNLKIKIRGLSKRFGPKCVLNKIDLDIQQGKSLVILGGSGSGKSVLIKCILGIIENDKGDIYLDDTKINYDDAKSRDRIISQSGMLFQGGALFDSLSIWENIAFGLFQRRNISREEGRVQALDRLKEV